MKEYIQTLGLLLGLMCSFGILHASPVPDLEGNHCGHFQMRCGATGKCISISWKCDGDSDCEDGGDELECPPRTCADLEMRCLSGSCIPERWQCDGEPDCPDGDDERNCTATCTTDQFTCGDGQCIQATWACDGVKDCENGFDEADCSNLKCDEDQFRCKTVDTCVSAKWVCDGDRDCSDGSDEGIRSNPLAGFNCSITCKENEFLCLDQSRCIDKSLQCDGDFDCIDHSDETDCKNHTVQCSGTTEFQCVSSGGCIHISWKCDGDIDCEDGSDEHDAANCITCKENEFLCLDQSRCIDKSLQCDGDFDCIDHSDETDCKNHTVQCSGTTEFQCVSSGGCIHISWKCDGDIDCEDGSDEHDAANCGYQCLKDQFKCSNNICISDTSHCDGIIDCLDGSDEINCSKKACSDVSEFDCNGDGSLCFPGSKVCDGHSDCQLGQDEDPVLCKLRNPCMQTQCGEHAHCENYVDINEAESIGTPQLNKYEQIMSEVILSRAECVCDTGFKWDEVEKACKDIDECHERAKCSQICSNTEGGYKCECTAGYVLEKGTFCKAEGEKMMLYFTNRRDIRRVSQDSRYMDIVVGETENSIALDMDIDENILFWSALGTGEIRSVSMRFGASDIQTVIKSETKDAVDSSGLAVDWLYRHIYWTDTGSDTIKVTDYNGSMVKTLIDSGLDEPRAICLDPENGFMYWSDWGQDPKIERSGMDGSGRSILVHDELRWPNGLTIDYVDRRLYWIDAKLHRISSARLDGSDIFNVLHDYTVVNRPFSIAVFEDSLYWTDWQDNSIKSVNKLTGRQPETISIGSYSIMDIQVYHDQKQETGFRQNATDLCKAASCEEFCLPRPHFDADTDKPKEVVCACANGKALLADQKSCLTPCSN